MQKIKSNLKMLFAITIAVSIVQCSFATDADSTRLLIEKQKRNFYEAKNQLEEMLSGKKSLDYEMAVFVTENAYWDNQYDYESFKNIINSHLENISAWYNYNNNEKKIPFKRDLLETTEVKKNKYGTLLKNWAIYSYLTDTMWVSYNDSLFFHPPYLYSQSDPLANDDWRNSQTINLLFADNHTGNCYALTSLFKIFAERLNTDAQIATAPGHIYIVHNDEKNITHNVELASRTFPGNGSIEVLTFTTNEAVKNGISLRYLDLKQSIALNLIYLAKGFQHKFNTTTDEFMLNCANTALKYDSLNLNAMLLKAEILESRLFVNIENNKVNSPKQLEKFPALQKEFKNYEKLIVSLYNLGYLEMPIEMQNILISTYKKDNALISSKDHTPSASKSLGIQHDPNYITLSNGLFEELHEPKRLEKYSRITFDTKIKKIVAFGVKETTYNNYSFDPAVFAWNIDPLAHKLPSWSPYAFCINNPIIYVDPDGQIPWPVLAKWTSSTGKTILRRIDSQFKPEHRPNHKGIDMNLGGGKDDAGVPVYATHTGMVMISKDKSDKDAAGNRIHIVSDDGSLKTVYMHLKDPSKLKEGDIVKEGDVIGFIGGSGFGKDDGQQTHLHYEIHTKNEKGSFEQINPLNKDGSLKDPQKMLGLPTNENLPESLRNNKTNIKPENVTQKEK